jgi:hypothetical protein
VQLVVASQRPRLVNGTAAGNDPAQVSQVEMDLTKSTVLTKNNFSEIGAAFSSGGLFSLPLPPSLRFICFGRFLQLL